jgi:hypothetical protein
MEFIMKKYLIIVVLTGFMGIQAFDELQGDLWYTPSLREIKLENTENKLWDEWHGFKDERYAHYKHGVSPRSNMKFWDFQKLRGPRYPAHIYIPTEGYYYQKPSKTGKVYPRYTLSRQSPQADINAEIDRREAYLKKLEGKKQELENSTFALYGKWLRKRLGY